MGENEKQVADLELKRETIQELAEREAEGVQGGLLPAVYPPAAAGPTFSIVR
jgi:hypothetical protein